MTARTDFRRSIKRKIEKAQNALTPVNCIVEHIVVDGDCADRVQELPDQTPESIKRIGGVYHSIANAYTDSGEKRVVRLTIQMQQLPALISTAQFIFLSGGQRAGKTDIAATIANRMMIEKPGSRVACVLPSYTKEDIIIDKFNNFKPLPVHIKGDHRIDYPNGSSMWMFSVSPGHEDSFLGYEYDLVWLSEFREVIKARRVFNNAFSRIINTGGRIMIDTSPECGHLIEDIYIKGNKFDE